MSATPHPHILSSCLSPPVFSIHRREIEESRREAEKDGIKVPSTLEEYCQQYRPVVPSDSHSDFDLFDDYDENDDYICSDEEDDVMEDGEEEEDNEDVDDSGCNGNS